MVAIADAEGVIGLAGIMGGASTEVSLETSDVLLEAAYWDPPRIRRTRRALGMSTEASYRFERNIDRWAGGDAMRRCIELVLATGGGELADPPLDLWPEPSHPPRIFLRPARVAQVLGVEVPWNAIEQYLVAIGATVVSKPDDGRIAVDVPGWRPDLVREIDLIEEIARLHGYDTFPSDLRPFRMGSLPDAPEENAAAAVRRGMVEQGLYEVSRLPLGPADGDESVRLLNPLSADDAWLRRRLLPGLVRLVEGNWANHVEDVRLFEIGTTWSAGKPGERPREERRLAAVFTGHREPPHWTGTGQERFDLWDLKGRFEAAVALAIPGAVVQVERSAWVARDAEGRIVGEAAPLAADAPPWAAPLFGFELVLDPSPRRPPQFTPLPATPASERVLALLLPEWGDGESGGGAAPAHRRRAARAGRGRERLPRPRAAGRRAERGVPAGVPGPGPHPARRGSGSGRDAAPGRARGRAGRAAAWCRRGPRRRVTMAYSYDRPDLKALGDLEQLLKHLTEELAGWRRRTLRAEAELAEAEAHGGKVAGPELKEARKRVIELEAENQALRHRIEAARERLKVLAARLSFLEQHGGGNAA